MKEIDLGECRRTIELLPWYANNSLQDAERKRVDAHLDTCAACRREAHFLGTVIEAMPEPRAAHDGSAPFSALLQKINHAEQRNRRWKTAAALFLVAGLVMALPAYLLEPRFETVTDAAVTNEAPVQLALRFAGDNNAAALANVLEQYNAELVAGPLPDQTFIVEFRATEAAPLLQQLRENPQVIVVRVAQE